MTELTELEKRAVVTCLRSASQEITRTVEKLSGGLSVEAQDRERGKATALTALADKIEQAPAIVELVLHEDDGSDEMDEKNVELHKFFAGSQVHDFEGGGGEQGSGISIWVLADPGDTLFRYPDGSVRVLRQEQKS